MNGQKLRSLVNGYQFLLPFLIVYAVFTLYPLVQGFLISFAEWNIVGTRRFVAFRNYDVLFHDPIFWSSLRNTVYFTVVSTPILMISGFSLALLLDSRYLKLKSALRGVFFAPAVLSVSVVSSIWVFVLARYTGLLNAVLGTEIGWTNNPRFVWWAIIMLTVWWTQGFNMILYLAGLQEIPTTHFEAARIEGASFLQQLRYIIVPSLKNIHVVVFFLQTIAGFRVFGQVFLVTRGGPGGATRTIIQYLYELGFERFALGEASAIAFLLFILVFAVSMAQRRLFAA